MPCAVEILNIHRIILRAVPYFSNILLFVIIPSPGALNAIIKSKRKAKVEHVDCVCLNLFLFIGEECRCILSIQYFQKYRSSTYKLNVVILVVRDTEYV